MAREIERKYLILGDAWRALPVSGVKDITQAYLAPGTPVSIQFDNGKAAFSFGTKAGAVAFAVPVAGDFTDIRAFPNYDAATGRLAPDPAMVFRIRTAGEGPEVLARWHLPPAGDVPARGDAVRVGWQRADLHCFPWS